MYESTLLHYYQDKNNIKREKRFHSYPGNIEHIGRRIQLTLYGEMLCRYVEFLFNDLEWAKREREHRCI